MKNPFAKTPFLFLLIPLIAGILLQYYLDIQYISIAFFSLGILAMLFSYFVPKEKQFGWRWLFGAGALFFLIAIGIVCTIFQRQKSDFSFSTERKTYRGIITDTPQEKARTTAYKVRLVNENKNVVCYLQRDSTITDRLKPGEEILFEGKIQPFQNIGDFDYVSYMHNQGFAGSAYIPIHSWEKTGNTSSSLKLKALGYRQKILDFYKSLGFDDTEYSILSALTLGYKNELSDELTQGFRTTGTVHVLSTSGLHVGIIYLMISFLLGFIRKGNKYYKLRPTLIILLLWVYAFVTGLPASVVRASIMLSFFCAAELFDRRSISLHAMFIAAFFMLLYNPLSLFDVGFQLSFASVLSILYLQPKASSLLKIENTYLRNIWQMFTLSVVAQLATFPICLYYFGTFPTYFFITNLIVVPLVSLIIYSTGGIAIAKIFSYVIPNYSDYLFFLPVKILQWLVQLMTSIIRFFEKLPFAQLEDIKISFIDLLLIYTFIISVIMFFVYKKPKVLIVGLSAFLGLIVLQIYGNLIG